RVVVVGDVEVVGLNQVGGKIVAEVGVVHLKLCLNRHEEQEGHRSPHLFDKQVPPVIGLHQGASRTDARVRLGHKTIPCPEHQLIARIYEHADVVPFDELVNDMFSIDGIILRGNEVGYPGGVG